MRAMPFRSLRSAVAEPRLSLRTSLSAPGAARAACSSRALCVAAMAFVLALGAGERQAYAQQTPSKQEQKDKSGAAAGTSEEEEEKTAEEQKTEEAKKTEEATEEAAPPKQALDTSVESAKAIYFSGDFAFTRSDLGLISDNTGFDKTGANGLLYGLSAGLRLRDVRLGARWRVYDTTESTLWSFALSAGYGLPIRPISPVFSAHVGYVFDQHIEEALYRRSLPPGTLMPPNIEMRGLLVGVDVNASYWVTQFLRIGAFIGADAMFLHRDQATLPRSIYGIPSEFASNPLYTGSGSSIGLNLNAGLRGAFDIAFR